MQHFVEQMIEMFRLELFLQLSLATLFGAGIRHARPDPNLLEDLETVVRRTGLHIERQASRRENVDLVIDFTLRGPKRLHDQVMIALLNHPGVRTVSTGE